MHLQELVTNAIDKGKLLSILLIDQKSAYDVMDQNILLEKLAAYSFQPSVIKWLESYLGGRKQAVKVGARTSPFKTVGNFGCPQGTILAGLLFIIFANDLPYCNKEGDSLAYIDDSVDILVADNEIELQTKTQIKAEKSEQWL